MVEATNSWAYVGAGLRILIELLGPEYSMEFSSLNTGLKVFLSRDVTGGQGEDLVEKQNAEQGLMPVVENEPDIYGYIGEDRHMVEAFRHRRQPMETFHDGVAVAEMLMALYRSAEIGQTVRLPARARNLRPAGGALLNVRRKRSYCPSSRQEWRNQSQAWKYAHPYLRKTYGRSFARGCGDDEKLGDVLRKLDEPSLAHLIRDHEGGRLKKVCQEQR